MAPWCGSLGEHIDEHIDAFRRCEALRLDSPTRKYAESTGDELLAPKVLRRFGIVELHLATVAWSVTVMTPEVEARDAVPNQAHRVRTALADCVDPRLMAVGDAVQSADL